MQCGYVHSSRHTSHVSCCHFSNFLARWQPWPSAASLVLPFKIDTPVLLPLLPCRLSPQGSSHAAPAYIVAHTPQLRVVVAQLVS